MAIAAIASTALAGCGFFDRHFHKENDAYKTSVQEHPLEVPPDLDKPNTTGALTIPDAGSGAAAAPVASGDASAAPALAAASAAPAEAPVAGVAAPTAAVLAGDTLHVADTVDSTWNRVGLALERSGAATVLARDEAGRSYDVQTTGQVVSKPGWFKKVVTLGMAKGTTTAQVQFKLRVTAEGDGSKVAVEGTTDQSSKDAAQALLATLKQRLS
ncbi:MAG TPA: hypothetical protein VGO25_02280 [Rhodanobacteraceae bacterium]|nr:hypothetical protein [Rhodanobacteraceae bacterium]